MKKWTTTLQVKVKNIELWVTRSVYNEEYIKGIVLARYGFALHQNPLSYLLNRTKYGFGILSGNQEMQRLYHILYMDDIKWYAATNNQLQELLRLTQAFSRNIKMVFGIETCKKLCVAKGKLEMRNFTTEDDGTMEAMNQDDLYRYLGHVQAKQMKQVWMKQKLGEEYLNRTKSILKTKLNGKKIR